MNTDGQIVLFSSDLFLKRSKQLIYYWLALPLVLAILFGGIRMLSSTEYEAKTVLAPSEERTGGLAEMAGALGGLAGLAGIDLGAMKLNNTQMAVELMKSRSFIYQLIEENDLLPLLMAVEKWDEDTQEIIFDKDIYNSETKTWVREVSPPQKQVPELWEGYEKFSSQFEVNYDRTTRIVTLSLEHQSPDIAAHWLELVVETINSVMRERESQNVEDQITYLNENITKAQQTEVRESLYYLLQEQYKRAMLVSVNEDYVFEMIDPPVSPHKPSGLSWKVWFIIGGFIGTLMMFGFTLWSSYKRVDA